MTTIWERTAAALGGLGLPVAASVEKLTGVGGLPDAYLVHFLVSEPAEQHADNQETLRGYRVQVSYYSRAGLIGMPDVVGAMVGAGFARAGARELGFNQQTGHYGLALDFFYMESEL